MAGGVTLTVRAVRSFEHRNIKYIVYKDVDLNQTAESFLSYVLEDLKKRPGIPPPVRNYQYDTMKIEYKAQGAKTQDPVINKENDETLIINKNKTLLENGIGHETEISLFKQEDYERYKQNPTLAW